MDIGLMVPGHLGLDFDCWRNTLRTAERLGFASVFHSDHFFTSQTDANSPDAVIQMTIAAETTQRIRFGVLVSPITFRHPVHLARAAAQLGCLSDGRFVLGLGAGWFRQEHAAFGFPFPAARERFDRLGEALHVIRALWGPEPASFEGAYYHLDRAQIHPKLGARQPTIVIGGAGEQRTLPLVAQYADEWNSVNLTLAVFADKSKLLDRACEVIDRDPATVRRSVELFGLLGPTRAFVNEARRRIDAMFSVDSPIQQLDTSANFGESPDEIVEHIGRLGELGVDEVVFQLLFPETDELQEYIATEIMRQVARF